MINVKSFGQRMAAYGDLPIFASSTDAEKLRLFADIVWDQKTTSAAEYYLSADVVAAVQLPMLVTINGHGFFEGEELYITGSTQVGYTKVLKVVNTNQIVIDWFDPTITAIWTNGTVRLGRKLTFRTPLDREGQTYWNFKDTLNNFVKSNYSLPGTDVMDARSTRFNWSTYISSESTYEVGFQGFVYTTDKFVEFDVNHLPNAPLFQVGDTVSLFTGISEHFSSSQARFTSSGPNNGKLALMMAFNRRWWKPGTQVTLTGFGTANAQYNGVTTVLERFVSGGTEVIVVDHNVPAGFSISNPVFIRGRVRPELDLSGTITNRVDSPSSTRYRLNVKYPDSVGIDGVYTAAGFPALIEGLTRDAFGRLRRNWQEWTETDKTVYQGNIDSLDWTDNNFADRIISTGIRRKWSTDLKQIDSNAFLPDRAYPVNFDAINFLLAHTLENNTRARYRCYNSAGTLISDFSLIDDNTAFLVGEAGPIVPPSGATRVTLPINPDTLNLAVGQTLINVVIGGVSVAGSFPITAVNQSAINIQIDIATLNWPAPTFPLSFTASVVLGPSFRDYYVPIGLQKLLESNGRIETVGNFANVINQIQYWSVTVWNSTNTARRGQTVWFKRTPCTNWEPITLSYRDQSGSLIGIPANESHRISDESENDQYNNRTGRFVNEIWTHGTGRELKTYTNRSRKKMRVTTDWLKEDMNFLAIGFLKSSEQYITYKGELIPINVLNEEIEDKQTLNDKIYNYEFEIEFAYDERKK